MCITQLYTSVKNILTLTCFDVIIVTYYVNVGEIMELLKNTLEILMLDPDFILKKGTNRAKELTAEKVLKLIIEDKGRSRITEVLKGHDILYIRKMLKDMFIDFPKADKSHWYLHILAINGVKKCPCCLDIKDIDLFSKNKSMLASGRDSWCLVCVKTYREVNSDNIKLTKRLHQLNNKMSYVEASARRRARKILAMPKWANVLAIKEIYDKCPEGYHVDHWAPLQGVNVCGLHTAENLQYIPASINISKGNSFKDTDAYREYH